MAKNEREGEGEQGAMNKKKLAPIKLPLHMAFFVFRC